MIPRRAPDQSFKAHQKEMAAWMGYPDAAAMNRDHDALHASLCDWLGVRSHALRQSVGETLSTEEATLAAMEEEAVLYLQRFMRHAGAEVPQPETKP